MYNINFYTQFPLSPPPLPRFDGVVDLFEASFPLFDPNFPPIEAIFLLKDAREDQKGAALALFDATRYILSSRV